MELRTIIWPRSRKDYSMRAAAGRVLHVAMLLIGSFGVVVELVYWHGRWDHLAVYGAMWVAYAALGRIVRLVLAHE